MSTNIQWEDDKKNRKTTTVATPSDIPSSAYKDFNFSIDNNTQLNLNVGESVITELYTFTESQNGASIPVPSDSSIYYLIEKLIDIGFDLIETSSLPKNKRVYYLSSYITHYTLFPIVPLYALAFSDDSKEFYYSKMRWRITRIA